MAACAKLHEMQFLCIEKRVTVNSNDKAADQVVHHEKSKQKLFS